MSPGLGGRDPELTSFATLKKLLNLSERCWREQRKGNRCENIIKTSLHNSFREPVLPLPKTPRGKPQLCSQVGVSSPPDHHLGPNLTLPSGVPTPSPCPGGSLAGLTSFGCKKCTLKCEKSQLWLVALPPAVATCSREEKGKHL